MSNLTYSCRDCNKDFDRKSNYSRHLKSILHQKKAGLMSSNHTCTICNFTTKYKSNFNSHMKIHNQTAKYQCKACNTFYTSIDHVFKHISTLKHTTNVVRNFPEYTNLSNRITKNNKFKMIKGFSKKDLIKYKKYFQNIINKSLEQDKRDLLLQISEKSDTESKLELIEDSSEEIEITEKTHIHEINRTINRINKLIKEREAVGHNIKDDVDYEGFMPDLQSHAYSKAQYDALDDLLAQLQEAAECYKDY